jgi:hypothetical protein
VLLVLFVVFTVNHGIISAQTVPLNFTCSSAAQESALVLPQCPFSLPIDLGQVICDPLFVSALHLPWKQQQVIVRAVLLPFTACMAMQHA